jgi:Tfp pilus assembly protein FimT
MRQERTLSIHSLETAIEFARSEAFQSNETVTLCMSIDQKSCIIGRGNSYLIFRNKEKNAQPKDKAILRVGTILAYGTLEFKCFGNSRSALDIEPDGFTYNNGHFCYCPLSQNSKEADGLIMNNATRFYRPSHRDSLGILMIDKNSSLSCY